MQSDDPILIISKRPVAEGNEISREQWLSYLAASPVLQAIAPAEHQGMNPFTKEPTVFRSPPGAAYFQGPRGRCEIEYHAGSLVIRGAAGHAEAIVDEIAQSLGAEVERFDPSDDSAADR